MPIPPLYQFDQPSGAALLHLAVANGFPPQTYRPLVAALGDGYRVISFLPRGLWQNGVQPESMSSWRVMADDLLAGLRAHDMHDVIAVGHSMGGIASMLAVIAEPARFKALILLDPTIFLPTTLRWIGIVQRLRLTDRFPLVKRTLRRRRTFPDVEAAHTYFRTRPLFANWPGETVRLYAESMTRPATTAMHGVELAWPPEWEAQYYRTIFTAAWQSVPRLRGLLPVLVIRGSETDTFVAASARRFQQLVPEATLRDVPGHGHLFPQSAPHETAHIVRAWLAGLA